LHIDKKPRQLWRGFFMSFFGSVFGQFLGLFFGSENPRFFGLFFSFTKNRINNSIMRIYTFKTRVKVLKRRFYIFIDNFIIKG